eukprot:CAMPEP_0170513356 /NCGR_PEP_ID=MMETSP0208-20121228/67355_1 /TAXON_ID=197538 /ORGANISM="Strombidium inclinatum, Strain S3" /LENGTH=141 /DNA_ID=CAMNT_0010797081 /DNA_START=1241 /DNA_END=1666 /DNA_ORIENTATION=-
MAYSESGGDRLLQSESFVGFHYLHISTNSLGRFYSQLPLLQSPLLPRAGEQLLNFTLLGPLQLQEGLGVLPSFEDVGEALLVEVVVPSLAVLILDPYDSVREVLPCGTMVMANRCEVAIDVGECSCFPLANSIGLVDLPEP